MLEKLGNVLRKTTDKIANAIFLDKGVVDSIVKDLQRALIEADVNVRLVKEISDKIKKAALDERIKGIEKKEHIIKLLHDELKRLLGEHKKLTLDSKNQNRIMLIGLYGSGKTTTTTKLANYFGKRGNKTAVIGLDVHRPAAAEQLKQNSEKNNINCFIDTESKDALKTWEKFEKNLKEYKTVIVDTAGRHNLDQDLIEEISSLNKKIKPTEIILVLPADIGQAARDQASSFMKVLNISGVIITRMDSSAKGGGTLTACAETNAPVYFITNGEKINDIEEFNPENFLSRLLGMGDLQNLLEKIRSVTDSDKQSEIQKRLEEGKLNLEDVIEQIKSMNQIGGFDKIKSMIPGFGKVNVNDDVLENQQQKIKKWEHIIKSMTKQEKENPELLEKQTSRISRIAKGSGTNSSDVRSLLKQYKMLKELVKSGSGMNLESGTLDQKQMMKLARKFGKKKFRL